MFLLGTKVISWTSKNQKTVALLLGEKEYIVGTSAIVETVWLRKILQDLQQSIKALTKIYYDNMFAIAMTNNSIVHSRTKHIEIRHHFI